jgi:membrane-associated protein
VHGAFETFRGWYAVYGYPVLFLGVLLENAGVPVPGETAVLVASFLASPAGGGQFELARVILLTCIAAIVGDNVGYWLGRRLARPTLERGRRWLLLTPERLKRIERYFARYGSLTVFVARFVTGLRILAAPAAGVAGMRWPRFFAANAAGAVVWALAVSLAGYLLGRSWERLQPGMSWGVWIVLGALLLALGARRLWRARVKSTTAAG